MGSLGKPTESDSYQHLQLQLSLDSAAGLKIAFSLKDIFFGSTWCPPAVTSRAMEEQYFKERVSDFRNHSALLAWCESRYQPPSFPSDRTVQYSCVSPSEC